MNYIHKLHEDHNRALDAKEALEDGIRDLITHLCSEKFHCGDRLDGYVNVQDVIDRLRNLDREVWEHFRQFNIQRRIGA